MNVQKKIFLKIYIRENINIGQSFIKLIENLYYAQYHARSVPQSYTDAHKFYRYDKRCRKFWEAVN